MNDAERVDQRLDALEIKLSFVEDLVERLNETVARQSGQIDLLVRHVAKLGEQLAQGNAPTQQRNLGDELPPHY